MKTFLLSLAAVALVGCASFNSTVFYAEKTAADTATGAVHSWNVYYQQATNGAAPAQIASLNTQQAAVYSVSRKLGATLAVAEAMRQSYATNSASTNAVALQTALDAALNQSTNLVNLIKLYMGK